jgi:L-seryl-tRNA(Ser) seleniumtransferase
MSFYDELGITRYINAHDTYTIYGGSRMSANTLKAMAEAAESFVDIDELQYVLGCRIAGLTNNEAAYITNGASGGLLLAAAVCMTGGDEFSFSRLPDTDNIKNEIIVMRCQRNAYDKAIEASGAHLLEIGDADETLEYELEGVINERTAAVFYFESSNFRRASMPLDRVIDIAHKHGIPVVVDAAAQLPPVSNLWKFTKEMGADMAIFSGGKTLCGPQDSGLILGKEEYISICRRFGAPVHGICRSSKVSREAMAGLYQAVKDFTVMDEQAYIAASYEKCRRLRKYMERTGLFTPYIVEYGPVGQAYPRIFGKAGDKVDISKVREGMLKEHIYIGTDNLENTIYFSPLNLTGEEVDIVGEAFIKVCTSLYGSKA